MEKTTEEKNKQEKANPLTGVQIPVDVESLCIVQNQAQTIKAWATINNSLEIDYLVEPILRELATILAE